MSRPDPLSKILTATADRPIGLDEGRLLAATIVSGDCRAEIRNDCTCAAQRIIFVGRTWEHALCLGSSTRARILAHWAGYIAPPALVSAARAS